MKEKTRTVKVKIDGYLKFTLEVLAEKRKMKASDLASNLVARRCNAPSPLVFKAVFELKKNGRLCADKVQCTAKKGADND